MASLVPWIEVTITGFLYLFAIFFLTLRFLRIGNLRFLKKDAELLPYIAILAVFFSYVLGLAAHLVADKLITYLFPYFAFDANANIKIFQAVPEDLQRKFGESYSNLVLFRHLVIASFTIAISMFSWFWGKQPTDLKWRVVIVCLFILDLFLIAYSAHRKDFVKFKEALSETYKLYAP